MKADMTNTIIETIIQKKRPCYFISPHFDDAVFSAGSLLLSLSGRTHITLVNVFTKAGSDHTLSAKAYLKQCMTQDSLALYEERQKEDKRAVQGVVDEVISLGFTEALWRKKSRLHGVSKVIGKVFPEVMHVYPTYRFHISKGAIAKEDSRLVQKLRRFIHTLPEDAVIFCPLGIGNHVDHVLVREACLQSKGQVVLWSDFPYSEHNKASFPLDTTWQQIAVPAKRKEKRKLMQAYHTQYLPMFGKTQVS